MTVLASLLLAAQEWHVPNGSLAKGLMATDSAWNCAMVVRLATPTVHVSPVDSNLPSASLLLSPFAILQQFTCQAGVP